MSTWVPSSSRFPRALSLEQPSQPAPRRHPQQASSASFAQPDCSISFRSPSVPSQSSSKKFRINGLHTVLINAQPCPSHHAQSGTSGTKAASNFHFTLLRCDSFCHFRNSTSTFSAVCVLFRQYQGGWGSRGSPTPSASELHHSASIRVLPASLLAFSTPLSSVTPLFYSAPFHTCTIARKSDDLTHMNSYSYAKGRGRGPQGKIQAKVWAAADSVLGRFCNLPTARVAYSCSTFGPPRFNPVLRGKVEVSAIG